jgi:hypothetical protein
MLSYINTNTNSVGYVSAESVDYLAVQSNEKPLVKDNISNTYILDFIDVNGNVISPSVDNIGTTYGVKPDGTSLVRGFNQF